MENLQLAIDQLNTALADFGVEAVEQTGPSGWTQLSFWFCVAAFSVMLLVVVRMIHSELKKAGTMLNGGLGGGDSGKDPAPDLSLFMRTRVTTSLPTGRSKEGAGDTQVETDTDEIFSRTAGAIGAGGLAAIFVTLGYWIIYALHFDPEAIYHLNGLSNYFLLGAALFAPYAIDKVRDIFK